ncbi:MAG: AMP-binding protein [Thermoleophilaceae bacterium]
MAVRRRALGTRSTGGRGPRRRPHLRAIGRGCGHGGAPAGGARRGEGDRVATTLPPGPDFVSLVHACARVRAALVPLNTRLPASGRRAQAELAAPRLTIDEPLEGEQASEPPPGPAPAAVLTVVFTSGTTGAPKPVPLTVANHAASAAAATAALGTAADDRWLCPLPLFHVGGLGVVVRTAIAGATAVFEGTEALDRVTLASMVATQLARLRDDGFEPERPRARFCWAAARWRPTSWSGPASAACPPGPATG